MFVTSIPHHIPIVKLGYTGVNIFLISVQGIDFLQEAMNIKKMLDNLAQS